MANLCGRCGLLALTAPFTAETLDASIGHAREWLLESGIQKSEGGVARFYRTDSFKYAPVSTEITAYYLSALTFLGCESSAQAQYAAKYLMNDAWDSTASAFRFEPQVPDRPALSYFFDCGIAGASLLEISPERAMAAGRSMLTDFSRGGDGFSPVIRLPEKQHEPLENWWSRNHGCYQLKAALLWLRLGEAPFRKAYLDLAAQAIDGSKDFLTRVPQEERMDWLHAFLYFLEGLLPLDDQPGIIETINEGIAESARQIALLKPAFVRSDVYAQLIRLRLGLASTQRDQTDMQAITGEIRALLSFQTFTPDAETNGAFAFGAMHGQLMPYANPVSTIFAIQALVLWRRFINGSAPADWRTII